MEYKEKLDKILSHYGEEYQDERLEIEVIELNIAIYEKKMNDFKLELAEKNKEIFEIKDNVCLKNNILSEIADCCVLVCQLEGLQFCESYENIATWIEEINLLDSKLTESDKEKVREIFYQKIDRQIERIEKNV